MKGIVTNMYTCVPLWCARALLQNYVKEDKVTNAVDMPVSASAGRGCVFCSWMRLVYSRARRVACSAEPHVEPDCKPARPSL